jgi:hypothetical protein
MDQMVLLVDFNRVRPDGRISALVPEHLRSELAWKFQPGMRLTVTDGEGTEMEATIDELPEGRPFVLLVPIPGTIRDSEYRFSADEVYAFLKQVG